MSNDNALVDNVISQVCGGLGRFQGQGVYLAESSRNLLLRNWVVDAPLGFWLRSGSDNLFRRNVVVPAAGDPLGGEFDGFHIDAAAVRTILQANTALRALDDGIDVDSPDTLTRRIVANDNGDLGIEGASSSTDGGGNRASGNGDPLQCVNVVCR